MTEREAIELLRKLTGDPNAVFRPDQLEAILFLVRDRRRVLLVQRTGWGKSAVYFIATRLLRNQGMGPTLLVSPLLALMRNQIDAAKRMGVGAFTINSSNPDEWNEVEDRIAAGEVDILLVSPERLANESFRSKVVPIIGRNSGLLVIDEAHCISDWGHDFRPDYRRVVRLIDLLPPGVPVLGCTATANDRVVADVEDQLGSGLVSLRGPLGREGLRLSVLPMPSQFQRMAWLAEHIPRLPGTGIIYCLTVRDTAMLASWLRSKGIDAVAYSGATPTEDRSRIEHELLTNKRKVVVATSALGMGFDKPDLAFVIHYQAPGSPIAYYQQVGRAGRRLDESSGILLCGSEDRDIQDYFITSAFPSNDDATDVVALFQDRAEPVSQVEILRVVNVRAGQLGKLMKMLEVEGAVEKEGSKWLRTLRRWSYDLDRFDEVTSQRRTEQAQMQKYIYTEGCRMEMLRRYLDDPSAEPCGFCDNCRGDSLVSTLISGEDAEAARHLRREEHVIEPRKLIPGLGRIKPDHLPQRGRSLAVWGDDGWSLLIRRGKQHEGHFDDQLVGASARLIRRVWGKVDSPEWITFVPSFRAPMLVADFADRLAEALGIPCHSAITKIRAHKSQKLMQNSEQQYANIKGVFRIDGPIRSGPVLLVDDIVDSRWTMTAVSWLLLDAGSGPVYPFALADAQGRW